MAKQRDRVVLRMIEDEMKKSFLDYSMSVIVQRALPDVRDGLKPVHRRILYSMHEAGLTPDRPFKKSATVVGDVLGRYHPHGDTAVYEALVRMVQDFSLRYPLVEGQGNFGSIDGDGAAAYRYTEARLSAVAMEMLADIERNTVDFVPNFDDRLQEPAVLPARLPNLLVNGSSGIAVGMSTNIPPHNLREVVRAALHLLDHPDCTVQDLMRFVPGPDFPTGALIVGREGIEKAYETGRGRIVMQARVQKETRRGGREQLAVTEIPYATSKARILEQIVDLAKKGRISDVSDLRDESDRDGIRVVIELKRGADAQKVLRSLLKWTSLQSTFGVIALALDNGVPREFTLKEMLERFRDHRVEVIVRRSRWELEKARDEAHVLEGLIVAVKNIEEVVRIIRGSRDRAHAAERLRSRFELSERQADAILQMRLHRLTTLESRELRERLAGLTRRIRELEALLESPQKQLEEVRRELEELAERYGDARRTRILDAREAARLEDLEAEEEVIVTVSHEGFVKQTPMYLYQRRMGSGKALAGMERYENDYLEHVFVATSTETLMFLTADGQAYWLPVADIPEAGRTSRGRALQQLLGLSRDGRVVALLSPGRLAGDARLVFMTERGLVKRTRLDQFSSQRSGGVIAINLRRGDRLFDVQVSDGTADVVLVSRAGRVIRFSEAEVSEVGRVAQGVRGIKLASGDSLVGAVVTRHLTSLCLVTDKGFVHRLSLEDFSLQGRDGMGVVAVKLDGGTGKVVGAKELLPEDELMVVLASGGTVRLRADQIPETPRGGRGERLVEVARGDRVVEVTRVGGQGGEDDAARRATGEGSADEASVDDDLDEAEEDSPSGALDSDEEEIAVVAVDRDEDQTGGDIDANAPRLRGEESPTEGGRGRRRSDQFDLLGD
ncbi:MAG TPA: DNA gyrase subunit A [Longimicrobiaceae bacterium]